MASLKAAFHFQDALLDTLSRPSVEQAPPLPFPASSLLLSAPVPEAQSNYYDTKEFPGAPIPADFDLSLSLGGGISTQLMSSLQLPTISHSQALGQTNFFHSALAFPAEASEGDSPVAKRRRSTQKACNFPDCAKLAHGPDYKFCLRHGGGYRCQMPGCPRSAYSTKYCSKHGGGPRCQFQGCGKGAISNSSFCRRHGGGPRCQHPNCTEGARTGFNYCLSHGGYNPCAFPSCPCPSLHTSSYCRQHNSYQRKMANAQVMALSGLTTGLFANPLDDFPHTQ